MNTPLYAKIDLTQRKWEPFPISEDYYRTYIGGKALAARLLLDLTEPGVEPLSEQAVIIINTAPLNGTGAPCSSRFNMTFKNVLTGGIATSNSGGQFGVMLKKAGYDGLILTGRADAPVTVEIVDGEVTIQDASALWGLDCEQTQERLPAHYGKLVIGPAGENLVRYASAASGERMSGRCGTGAALGAKQVKALTAYGTKDAYVWDRKAFRAYNRKWIKFLRSHPMTGEALPRYGSAGLVNKANATHALPTRNFQRGYHPQADAVSGETMTETRLVRNGNCVSCPIRCERRVEVYGKEVKGPEYETCGFFGPNIDAGDLDAVLKLNYLADVYGMDTISLASSIAFAMELAERGVKDFGVHFGDVSNLEDAVKKIALRQDGFFDLGEGTKRMAKKYGCADAAMNAKGLEMASYEPRRSVGMGLGYAVANRGGCHLNGGYMALMESVGVLSMDAQSPRAKAEFTVFMQNCLEAISSAGCCLFTAQAMIPGVLYRMGPAHPVVRFIGRAAGHFGGAVGLLLKASKLLQFNTVYLLPQAEALHLATGLKMKTAEFLTLGDRAYTLERLYNLREGLTAADDTLPKRLLSVPQDASRPDTVVPLDQMLPRYYKARGWSADGVPTEKKLNSLGVKA